MKPRFLLPNFKWAAMAVLGAALALAGCNGPRIVLCPGASILADTATRAVLKPGSAAIDPTAVLYTVEVTAINQTCSLDTRLGQSDSNIRISFRATRTPTGQAARYTVPYFLVINQAERIINKRVFNATVDFPAGASAIVFETSITDSKLKFENGRLPSDYQYLAGLELNETERAYLQAMGRVTP
jgi:hypothetical protein